MEIIKNHHNIIRKKYLVSYNLGITYKDVNTLNVNEYDYLYNIVKNSLETDRIPSEVLSATYQKSKSTFHSIKLGYGIDIIHKERHLDNVLISIDNNIIFDSLTFNNNPIIYVENNTEIELMLEGSLIYLEYFKSFYKLDKIDKLYAFELNGNYLKIKLKKS